MKKSVEKRVDVLDLTTEAEFVEVINCSFCCFIDFHIPLFIVKSNMLECLYYLIFVYFKLTSIYLLKLICKCVV